MTDLRHDEPCSSPRKLTTDLISAPVDTATLTERLLSACWAEDVCDIEPGLLRDAAAALSSLETRLEASEAQLARYITAHDGPDGSYARAVAAEAREKAALELARKGAEVAATGEAALRIVTAAKDDLTVALNDVFRNAQRLTGPIAAEIKAICFESLGALVDVRGEEKGLEAGDGSAVVAQEDQP